VERETRGGKRKTRLSSCAWLTLCVLLFSAVPWAADPVPFSWEKVAQREATLIAWMKTQKPVVETYIQGLKPGVYSPEPTADLYFLGRLRFGGEHPHASVPGDFDEQVAFGRARGDRSLRAYNGEEWTYFPVGFAAMIFPDAHGLNPDTYLYQYEGREYLGKTECLRFEVTPREPQEGRFFGHIWVETGGYNMVRFRGTFTPPNARALVYLHFDGWRAELQPNLWAPAYVYVEESDRLHVSPELRLKGVTLLWGYAPAPAAGKPAADRPREVLPVLRTRTAPFSEAPSGGRNRIVEFLQRDGLLAAEGSVEARLNEIVEQIRSDNRLPGAAVRCRVLLTTPLEAFSAGNTIILSRGLLDVIPNEHVLTVILAHQLAHILRGDSDIGVAPGTPSIFDERDRPALPWVKADREKEEQAAAETLTLLRNSRYGRSLGDTAGFFEEVRNSEEVLPNLSEARFGLSLSFQFTAPFLKALSRSANAAGNGDGRLCALGSRSYIQLTGENVTLGDGTCAPAQRPLEVLFWRPHLTMNSSAELEAASQ